MRHINTRSKEFPRLKVDAELPHIFHDFLMISNKILLQDLLSHWQRTEPRKPQNERRFIVLHLPARVDHSGQAVQETVQLD